MILQLSLIGCLALLCLAVFIARQSQPAGLPRPESVWFHSIVTWPIIVKAALGSFIFAADADTGTSYTLVTYGPATVMSVVMLVRRVSGSAKLSNPGVWIFLGVVFSLPFALSNNLGIAGILPALFVLPALLRRETPIPLDAWFKSARWALLLIVLAVTATSIIAPANVIGVCRLDKCSIFGEVLTSPITNNGNFVGVAVAILLPLALLGIPRLPMILIAAAGLAMVEMSGSRSAAAAAWIVALVVLLVSRQWVRRSWIAGVALIGTLIASTVTAVGSFSREFATFRGGLWARAQDLFWEHPVIGSGPGYWSSQPPELALVANYSPHNLWLEIAVSGGIIGLVCVVAAGIALLRRVGKQERYAFIMMLIALLALGVVEAPVQTAKLGLAPFAHLLPLVIAAACALPYANKLERRVDAKRRRPEANRTEAVVLEVPSNG